MPRSRTRRVVAPFLLTAFCTLAYAAPAHAEDEITIDHVETTDGTVSMVLSVDGIPDGTVDPSTVVVEVDGREVSSRAKTVAAGDIQRSAVLVLDASNSMANNGKFEAAVTAVGAYLDAAPEDVAIGLVTFAGDVVESISPTTDHASVAAALDTVTLEKGTSVYDAMREGVEVVGDDGSRSLLVLSDGADTSSDSTLDVAINDAIDSGVVVDVVSIGSTGRAEGLSSIADDTGGAVIPADPAALGSVFTAQADALAQQLLVSFDSPADVSGEATITTSVLAGENSYVDSAFVALESADAGVQVVEHGKALVSRPLMLLGVGAVFLGLVGLLGTVLSSPGKSSAERRLDAYLEGPDSRGGRRRSAASGSTDLKDSAVAITSKVVNADLETRISQRLAGAGSALTAAEWVLLHAGLAVGAGLFGFLMSGVPLASAGLLAGLILPWLYLKWRHRRRLGAFNGQLAQTLGLMAGGLQAGLSLPQAVDSVVREGHEPMAGELKRALIEQRLGVDLTEALDGVGQRMESEDFEWVVMAIRIQREVGGNLAEILHTVADTLREREYLRRQVRALSAEGRLSGYILTGLPPVIGLYMYFVNPEYLAVLYTTGIGVVMLIAAACLLMIGTFAMYKLAQVEV
ncbi:type II secretion system F family protein [Nocardioides sp. Soil777]|uniref:type II secretion system F family protein n=1 Tax=Nocardioides sp. Soil777 TaxID=1736409 RepID=UPI00138F20EC|nr:type II secretion system F family protein [Nocardioides sp. Soil777]